MRQNGTYAPPANAVPAGWWARIHRCVARPASRLQKSLTAVIESGVQRTVVNASPGLSLAVGHAPEADRAGAVDARSH